MNPPRRQRRAVTEQLFLDSGPTSAPASRRPTARAMRIPTAVEQSTRPAERVDLSQPLVDVDVIAQLLCVKRKRIYELARRPDDPLPCVRIGRAVRFVRAQVEEWVAHQTPP